MTISSPSPILCVPSLIVFQFLNRALHFKFYPNHGISKIDLCFPLIASLFLVNYALQNISSQQETICAGDALICQRCVHDLQLLALTLPLNNCSL